MGAYRGGAYGRIAVTLLAPLAALVLARIPLPGADLERIAGFDAAIIGVGALALRPFMSAALLVEVLAVLIPRWRALRVGGYAERGRVWTRVLIVALVLVALQSFFIARWMAGNARAFAMFAAPGEDRQSLSWMATQIVSLSAGTFLLYWLARLVDRFGAGSGFALVIAAFIAQETVPPLLASVHRSAGDAAEPGAPILAALCLAAVVAVAVTRLTSGRPLKASAQPPGGERLPTPASGIQPVVAGASAVAIPLSIAKLADVALPEALTPGTWMNRVLEAAVVGALCLLATWLFNRPRLIAQAWKRGVTTDADTAPVAERVRAAFARSLALALATCWVVMAVEWFCGESGLALSVVSLAMIACVVMDVAGEIRFRHGHGALVAVWPVHRLFLLPGLLKALDAAGIPAFARGRRARTLWNFMAPFLPVDILVPAAHAAAAETILRVRLGVDEPRTP